MENVRIENGVANSACDDLFYSKLGDVFLCAAQAKPAWQQEWEKTLEAAKKEGQVVVYISGYEAVLPDFEKEFPEIKVTAVTGRGNQLGQRASRRAARRKYLADVSSTGANPNYQQFYLAKALDPIKPALILPEVTDQTKWYLKKHQYSDPEGQYVFNYVGSATYGAVNYNTKLVNQKEFKSYWDLLNPKWKGKIEARDIREAGSGRGQHAVLLLSSRISGRRLSRNCSARWT